FIILLTPNPTLFPYTTLFRSHLNDNREPFIYKTTDFGSTWKKISDTLPKNHPLSYAMSVAENPNRRGMLFAGTGHAFYYSLDDRSEEHTSELQSPYDLVCRLL